MSPVRVAANTLPMAAESSQGSYPLITTAPLTSPPPPPLPPPVARPFFEPPTALLLAVYERTFFSDIYLGELELDLHALTEKRYSRTAAQYQVNIITIIVVFIKDIVVFVG